MSSSTIEPTPSLNQAASPRPQPAERPATPFKDVLASSINVLASGIETPASAGTGMPAAATAYHEDASPSHPGAATSDLDRFRAMQKDTQVFNLELLQLQEKVQNENRHFTTLSNVLKASHDTAKAAISNIRS